MNLKELLKMHKELLIVLIMCFFISSVSALEIEVKEIKCNYFNEFLEGQHETKVVITYIYDPNSPLHDNLALFFDFDDVIVFLDSTDRNELIHYIDKYKEWNIKASKKNIKLNKNIGSLQIPYISFHYGDKWHVAKYETIKFHFLSQTTQKHQFCIVFPELQSSSNEYISDTPETIYFWWSEIMTLRESLTDSAMEKYRKMEKEKREIDEEFK